MTKGIGFLYKDYIACVEKQIDKDDSEKYVFVWKHWDESLPVDLPVIFWSSDIRSFSCFMDWAGKGIEISNEDIAKLESEDCIPIELTKDDDNKLWIG